ncbi:MAG TPA: YkgJ family cysteine cluster protein [Methanocella sp.]|nr:YkgJ family cysteine cluster protein [Methanocella sp.]
MPAAGEEHVEGPAFQCQCCGQCCRRDPYYAVSLLDIRDIARRLGLRPGEFFDRFCAVVDTPGGFRYPAILAPDGCPFLRGSRCGIHEVNPIGCRVFPESALLPVRDLKKRVTAVPTCAILAIPDDDRPLKADLRLLAARDVHFEHTRRYFEGHAEYEERPGQEATDRLVEGLRDEGELERRIKDLRTSVEALVKRS